MTKHGPSLPAAGLAAILVVFATTGAGVAAPADPFSSRAVLAPSPGAMQLAQAEGAESKPRELQPRYEPVEPQPKSSYNDEYIFGLTRGIADSAMHPAAKVLLFPLTVPLDLVFLPFSAIGGLF